MEGKTHTVGKLHMVGKTYMVGRVHTTKAGMVRTRMDRVPMGMGIGEAILAEHIAFTGLRAMQDCKLRGKAEHPFHTGTLSWKLPLWDRTVTRECNSSSASSASLIPVLRYLI